MTRVSAVAIARNEALNLPGLITSLRSWVDELVLVDDGSTDEGPEIARAAGDFVRLIEHPMCPEACFAGQRNAGIDAANGDWLLHMDCDERVTPPLAEEIRSKVAGTNFNAFRYRRLNYFMNRPMLYGGWNSWNYPQLARRGYHRFEGLVHEQCVVDGAPEAIGELAEPMLHLNDENLDRRFMKSLKYVGLEAQNAQQRTGAISGNLIVRRTLREFLKKYVAQRGYRDGTPGLIAALHSATSIFRVNALVWESQNGVSRETLEEEIARLWSGTDPSARTHER